MTAMSSSDSAGPLPGPGSGLLAASWAGTVIFVISSVLGVIGEGGDNGTPGNIHRVVSLALFAIGCLAFISAFLTGVERSRVSEIAVSNLFFLAGSAPRTIRVHLFASLAIQVIVAVVAASVRPYTLVAFGILAPMYGLGVAGLWGAEHGVFRDRIDTGAGAAAPKSLTDSDVVTDSE